MPLGKKLIEIRRFLADYMYSEGCSCCRSEDRHEAARAQLARLLAVPKYPDGDGFDFYQFRTEKQPSPLVQGKCLKRPLEDEE